MAKRITKGNLWGFIQSRPYVAVADIRRLFMMEVDGAAPFLTSEGPCYIGLPDEVANLIRQLWQEGRIVLDMNPDVKARVVQGVYPARVPLGRAPSAPGPGRALGHDGPAEPRSGAPGAMHEPPGGKRKRRRKRRPPDVGAPDQPQPHPLTA